jgi:cell division protease FtsH
MKGRNTSAGPRNLIIAVVVGVLCLLVVTKLHHDVRSKSERSFSQFLTAIEGGTVRQVEIDGPVVQWKADDNQVYQTITPADPQLWQFLTTVETGKEVEPVEGAVPGVSTVGGDTVSVAEAQNTAVTVAVDHRPQLWKKLRKEGIDISYKDASTRMGLSQILLILAFILGLGFIWYMFRPGKNAGGGGGNIFTMGKSRAKMFMPSTIKEKFSSVAGAAEAKEELFDMVDFLKNPEKYKRLGAKITRGALLVGEPGNGKTLLARAVAGEANCPFYSISGSDFIEVFVGVGASRVRDLFAQARKTAPSIIFIDEIDAVGRSRGSGIGGGGNDEREQTLNQLLTEMDGFETAKEPVIVLAATNRPDVLDKALLRPGRFDRRIEVPYPDLVSREQILKVHAATVLIDAEVDMKKIARGTPGFTGADLANLINEAAIIASKQNQPLVTLKDFEEARDKILIGKEIRTIVLTEEDRKMTAYHEAGHALIRLLLPDNTDPLHKVTIVPRGRALGVTHHLPEREKYSTTKNEMLASLQSLLGGRIAEEMVFGELATGAYSDFRHATELARDMVCRYGMSEDLGPIVYSQHNGEFVYSQHTAERIDNEVRRITDDCYKKAQQLLTENRDKLDALAQALLEKETMYASEIYELLGITSREDFKLI